jgi:N-methylhydantoinase A
MYSIDIDIGGTFTDGFFTDGVEVRTEKVLTTPHDITECFVNCVVAGARAFGLDTSEFLRRSSVARVSTTVGTNLLVQRIGPRLGLIVTKGHEKFLYGNENNLVLDQYLPADMVVGVGEEVNDRGVVVREVEAANLLAAVRQLIAASARMIVISFRNAWRNPHNERLARALIRERYPVHYLRSVPLQIGTEVIHVADDEARTNSAVLNAYIHAEMARALYRAEDRLREAGFLRPLLVVHASGGSARVAKTVALHTLNSGPAAAAKGAAHLARLFGDTRVIATDMGGTSFDLSLIVDGQPIFSLLPELDGIRIATPMIEVDALGAGGGSIARLDGDTLRVGPDSAGAAPGPACYGKGGMEPTVTDANVVLGYMDPAHFLGGAMTLDAAAAARSTERRLARPLGCSIAQAAFAVREAINQEMAKAISTRLAAKGHDVAQFTMFTFGGSGPLHACAIAELTGIRRIVAFSYGSVFSAFGSSTTNVQHIYAKTLFIPAARGQEVSEVLASMRAQAERDMEGEGFSPREMAIRAEADVRSEGKLRTVSLVGKGSSVETQIAKARLASPKTAIVESVRLVSECAVPKWEPRKDSKSRRGAPPGKAKRDVWWARDGVQTTPVYDRAVLRHGHTVRGPAIIEGTDTGYAVAAGWTLAVDAWGNFIMTRDART